jgi:hypothetical protein
VTSNAAALPAGYTLAEYRVESLLGAGGFGLTYLATDINLNLKVALKEYLPADCAVRAAGHTLEPRTDADRDTYEWGLKRFLDEARTLASFRHPNIVRVMRFFEGNKTGYMVMEFVEGESLSTWMNTRRPLPQAVMIPLARQLLEGLAVIHRANYLHRDIKPPNIFMRADGSPVLLDFGSARAVDANAELTAMVSPGFAPFEQYHSQGNQGPWSDLYALGGVLYWMVTGSRPVEAAARIRKDTMPSAAQKGDPAVYTPDFLTAIDWALKPNEDERPQSVQQFLAALGAPATAAVAATTAAPTGMTTVVALGNFDTDTLKKVETELARHLGPIATMVVRNVARKSASYEDLCAGVVKEIRDEKARAECARKLAGITTNRPAAPATPRAAPATVHAPTQAGAPTVAAPAFSTAILQQAETALAQHIGAIAKVIVRRAATKARDEADLYLLISDEIKDPVEKKAFVRKAVLAAKPR